MNILLSGATGYIGKRLLPVLVELGHHVHCCVRDRKRFAVPSDMEQQVDVVEIDFANKRHLERLPAQVDAAFYLIHSMTSKSKDFDLIEAAVAMNFAAYCEKANCQQIIYLSAIKGEGEVSQHLRSRYQVEELLQQGRTPVTILRSGIIVGSGSASFEIIRDLVETLPVMVTPRWVNTLSQPIAIRNVIHYLSHCLLNPRTLGRVFDIGGPEVLSYKEMLLGYAKARGYKRYIWATPFFSPRLSSFWLYFVTSTNYQLAIHLVESMRSEVVCHENEIRDIIPQELFGYETAVRMAFDKIEQNMVLSTWKDALASSTDKAKLAKYIHVPSYGCMVDERSRVFERDTEQVLDNVWAIGGTRGWYGGNSLWRFRGVLDKLVGGVGLARGRRDPIDLQPGDALDFWRVLLADRGQRRLLLYSEMRLPGEAWLELRIREEDKRKCLVLTATYRPKGILGKLYWWSVKPFHGIVFQRLLKNAIEHGRPKA